MPINPNVALGAGGGSSDGGAFGLLGQMMSLRDNQQRQKANQLLLNQRQSELDDDDATREAFKKRTKMNPDGTPGEPDLDGIVYDLSAAGRGTAAMKIQDKIFEWNVQRGNELKSRVDANKTAIETASRIAQGITDDASFRRAIPRISALVGPDLAKQFGDKYDPDTIKQLVDQGKTASDTMADQRLAYEKGQSFVANFRNAFKDHNEFVKQEADLQKQGVGFGSSILSLAKNADDWAHGRQVLEQSMIGMPDSFRKPVLDAFSPTFSNRAIEYARKLGMTQNEVSMERDRATDNARQDRLARESDDAPLSEDAIRILGDNFANTGSMPAFGMGKQATINRQKVFNYVGDRYKNLDLAGQRAMFTSVQGALSDVTKKSANINAFEDTALKNLRGFLVDAKKVVDSGSPMLNKGLRWTADNIWGSDQVAAFNAGKTVTIPEFARILSSPNASGVLSDSARKEIEEIVKGNGTYKQMYRVAQTLVQDADNRRTSYDAEIKSLTDMISAPPREFQNKPVTPGFTLMRGPKGDIVEVPDNQVGKALAQGGIVLKGRQ